MQVSWLVCMSLVGIIRCCLLVPGFPRLLESPGFFFLKISRTWKVLENHFGPGKSWKLKLKVLESTGKNILESHAFF